MNNNLNKNQQGSTSLTSFDGGSRLFNMPSTPLNFQQPNTPQVSYYNLSSPQQDINSPSYLNKSQTLDLYNQSSTLLNPTAVDSPNVAQTPAMNLGVNDRGVNSPLNTPINRDNLFHNLAGSSPSAPQSVSLYKSTTSINSKATENKPITHKSGPLNIPPECEPKLQNIVSTANLGCQLKLRTIALQARNAEYNPKRFAAVIMRIREPKTTALIFSSGKMVCTGAKSEEESKQASRKYAKIIKSLGFPVEFKEFTVQNIVGSCDIHFQLQLSKLNMKLGKNFSKNSKAKYICHYEPEVFPGLIYHMLDPEIVLLIFVSGKIVLTGAKQKNQIYEAFNKIYPILYQHKMEKTGKSNKVLHQEEVKHMQELKTKETHSTE